MREGVSEPRVVEEVPQEVEGVTLGNKVGGLARLTFSLQTSAKAWPQSSTEQRLSRQRKRGKGPEGASKLPKAGGAKRKLEKPARG